MMILIADHPYFAFVLAAALGVATEWIIITLLSWRRDLAANERHYSECSDDDITGIGA